MVQLDVEGAPATLGPPPVGDEILTIIGPSRRGNHDGVALAPGFRLGHYEIVGTIGSGGMATVLKARDLELGRIVALKILPPDSARDPDSVTRFKQEARAAAKLDHDNVARVFFYGEDKGLHFIAFEFVEGETLRTLIEQQVTLAPADCLRYLLQLAAGLQHASDRGVIHRDVKPSNIVITPEGKAKIIDMGLARQQGSHSVHGGVTQSGMTLGTFDYISPEQALDPRAVDVRSDIYSLGCSFYHALTGRPPVPEGTAAKKLHAHQHEPPIDPRQLNPAVPDALAVILSGMMVKDRQRRYASPEALIRDLLAAAESLEISIDPNSMPPTRSGTGRVRTLAGNSSRRVPVGLAVGAGIAVAAVLLLVFTLGRGNKPAPLAWDDDFVRTERTARILDLPPNPGAKPAAKQTVQPATAEALLAALGQSNVSIQLVPGHVYDLSATAGAVFTGTELDIETQNGSTPATLKLAAVPVKWDDGPTSLRDGALTVVADAVRIRGVKFLFAQKPGSTEDALTPPVGLLIEKAAKLELLQCQFELDGTATASDGVGVFVNHSLRTGATELTVRNATVPLRRWVAFELAGTVKAEFAECGFATSRAGVRLSGEGSPPSVGLQFCTFLLENRGVAVDVDRAAAAIQSGFCVFASGNTDPPAMMMTEPNERRPAFLRAVAGSAVTATADRPNAFYRADFPADWTTAVDLKKHPWASANPVAKLDTAEPWKAFELNPGNAPLRVPGRGDVQILGVKNLPGDGAKIYAAWPPGAAQIDSLPPGVKVWYPNPPAAEKDSLPTNVFENLAQAIAALKPNDKLLIRGTGNIEVPGLTLFAKPDTNVTIRPEDERGTVTLFPADPTRLDSTMFKIEEGDVRFERIEFRLKPTVPKAGDLKSQSVVTLAGGGRRCEFHRCVFTMDQQKDEILAAVALVDLSEAMRKNAVVRRPAIRMEDCVLRGRGRAVWATTAFPFDFAASNVLAALTAPFVELDAPLKTPPSGATATVELSHVTALLGSRLIDLQCAKSVDDKPGAFLPVEIRADGCLFVSAAAESTPFALVRGGDPAQWDKYLTWIAGAANGYGNFADDAALLDVAVDNPEGKPKRVGLDDWLMANKEKATANGKVVLAKIPDSADGFLTVRPDEAAVKESTFAAMVGCRVKELPKPSR